ncbi:MAG: Minf_1886 family protein [bacterium]
MYKDPVFDRMLQKDPRYRLEAYIFVLEALHYARGKFNVEKHVTGKQLLEGIKELAIKKYGTMAKMVFEHWGVKKTVDFGNIVFNMVQEHVLSKTEEDKLEDFNEVYDFEEVFVKNYEFDFNNENRNLI